MNLPDISNLEDLLSDFLDNNKNHVNIERKRLSAPGENYGSLIIAIKITIEEDEKETVHNLVAKIAPPNEFLKQFMNISFTFRNEYAFYKTILPCFRQFQKKQNSSKSLDFFPKFFGGRLNMDSDNKYADDDAVILLENLKEQDYVMADKDVGFDLDASKLVLEKLAELHGVALALKTLKPELFEENLLPFFEEYQIFNIDEELVTSERAINVNIGLIEDDELCSLYYIDRIKETMAACCERIRLPKNSSVFRQGTFTTFTHGDVWINNFMVKLYNNKIVDVKLVDLQLYEYHSITKDILYFIFSSVQMGVLKNHIDDLINFYFNKLTENLKELQCDTEKFSFKEFMEEMKITACNQEYYHVMAVLHLIYADEHKVWDVDVIDLDKFNEQINVSEEAKKRGVLITREFIKRGWI